MDALEIGARYCKCAWAAAGCEKESVVRKRVPVVQTHTTVIPGNLGDAETEVCIHRVLFIELPWAQQKPIPVQRTREELLRQGRTLVRQPGLVAYHGQLPREAFAA
jgi:hypothetical protein